MSPQVTARPKVGSKSGCGMMVSPARSSRGVAAHARGLERERQASDLLERDGWSILARRLRTAAGEIDIVADRGGLTAMIEVKSRATLAEAAASLSKRQQQRLVAAAEIGLAQNPEWGKAGVRFDLFVFDTGGAVRRIQDAFCG